MEKYEKYVAVIGGTNIDMEATVDGEFNIGNMNKGSSNISLGGVGWNIALNLSYLNTPVELISALGEDAFGRDTLKKEKKLALVWIILLSQINTPPVQL